MKKITKVLAILYISFIAILQSPCLMAGYNNLFVQDDGVNFGGISEGGM